MYEAILLNYLRFMASLQHDEEGQDLIEYVLIAGLIALVAVVAITLAGTRVNAVWEAIAAKIPIPAQ